MTTQATATHTMSAPYTVTVDGRNNPIHQGQGYSDEEIASLVSTHGFESAAEAEGFALLMREAGHTVSVQGPVTITACQISPYVKGIRFQGNALDRLCRMVQYGELPYAVLTACHGIKWAQQTGRLCGTADVALSALKGARLAALVAAVANDCATMNDVPAFLNKRLG